MQTNLRTGPPANSELVSLNLLSPNKAVDELLKCCGSKEWAERVAAERPFETVSHFTESADRVWWSLAPADWLEAFHSHPRIGEKKAAAAVTAESQSWSEDEQSGIRDSSEGTISELARLNREYEEKFGYIFIVCASGKSSEEMLEILRQRLGNDAEEELRAAAAEQAKITELRLRKLVDTQKRTA